MALVLIFLFCRSSHEPDAAPASLFSLPVTLSQECRLRLPRPHFCAAGRAFSAFSFLIPLKYTLVFLKMLLRNTKLVSHRFCVLPSKVPEKTKSPRFGGLITQGISRITNTMKNDTRAAHGEDAPKRISPPQPGGLRHAYPAPRTALHSIPPKIQSLQSPLFYLWYHCIYYDNTRNKKRQSLIRENACQNGKKQFQRAGNPR